MKMMKTLSMAAALLAVTVGLASAAPGLNLNWQDCSLSGVINRNFACSSNSGSSQLISSFVAPAGLNSVSAFSMKVRMQTIGATLGAWWDIGGCRPGTAMIFSTDFSGTTSGGVDCFDYFAGATGGGFFVPNDGGANRALITHGAAYPQNFGAIPAGAEVYASRVLLSYTGTIGCEGGCLDGACLHLDEVVINQSTGETTTITNTATRSYVTWQGGGGLPCPESTPTKKATWGTIKSMYR